MAVLALYSHCSSAARAWASVHSAAVHTMDTHRCTSFSFEGFTSTIKFPYTLPRRIMVQVESMFSTIFWAVPLFMRVEPVTTSGPGVGAMPTSASWSISLPGQQVTASTAPPFWRAYRMAPST